MVLDEYRRRSGCPLVVVSGSLLIRQAASWVRVLAVDWEAGYEMSGVGLRLPFGGLGCDRLSQDVPDRAPLLALPVLVVANC